MGITLSIAWNGSEVFQVQSELQLRLTYSSCFVRKSDVASFFSRATGLLQSCLRPLKYIVNLCRHFDDSAISIK
jgi:hypothetical protein